MHSMIRHFLAAMLTLSPTLLAGCQIMAVPFILFGEEPTKRVPAEYPYLEGKKVVVMVWADQDTLFEYPEVQLEVAAHIEEACKSKVKTVAFVPSRSVADVQKSEPDWDRQPPALMGTRFHADRVMVIELTNYATREPENAHLFRGRISANVKIYDAERPDAGPLYKSVVETIYPPDTPGEWGSTDRGVRKATMEAFAGDVAGKFHERRVKLR